MKSWIMPTVKYQKEDDHGRLKTVTEKYLVDALSWTESESKVYEEIGQRVMGEFSITQMTKTKIIDVFEYKDSDEFYQCKVCYMIVDTDTGKEKKVSDLMLVNAHNIEQAYQRIHECLNNMLVTFTVSEIKISPILEIFHHEKAA